MKQDTRAIRTDAGEFGRYAVGSCFILDVTYIGATSFQDTVEMCALSKHLNCGVRSTIGGVEITAFPESNPHRLYEFVAGKRL